MQQPDWVPATDLALGDRIRYQQKLFDSWARKWTGHKRVIEGTIVALSSRQLTLSTSEGSLVKRLSTIEQGLPERLECSHRQAEVELARLRHQKTKSSISKFDPILKAIAKDDWRDRREAIKAERREG